VTRAIGIDTATAMAEVACVEFDRTNDSEPRVCSTVRRPMKGSHAVHLSALLDEALEEAGWNRTDPEGWVAVRGPGSFTGVRIALGAVQGLGFASGHTVRGVDRLTAMAAKAGRGSLPRVPLMGAGRGEVYGARFDATGMPPVVRTPPSVARPAHFLDPNSPARVVVDRIGEIDGLDAKMLPTGYVLEELSAGIAAAATALAFDETFLATDGAPVAPLYIRPSDAEIKRRG